MGFIPMNTRHSDQSIQKSIREMDGVFFSPEAFRVERVKIVVGRDFEIGGRKRGASQGDNPHEGEYPPPCMEYPGVD